MAFTDKPLTCRDCGKQFTFSAGEQEFYKGHGLMNEPVRCTDCRSAKRQSRGTEQGRQFYPATCAACGAETKVPFEPRGDRPVYCSDCFAKNKTT